MTTATEAQSRLTGAVAAHMPPAVVALVRGTLRRHPDVCGQRHVLGRPECQAFDEALAVLGLSR